MINSGSFIIKRTLKCSLLLVCSLLSVILFSCAGGAGGGGAGGEATSLCVQLPGTVERAASQYEKVDSNFQTFTVTIDSSSYKATKSCGSGETLKFENIPVGHYDVVAFAKRADGNVTAKGTASVDIEADVTKTVKITLHRLDYHTVTFHYGSGGTGAALLPKEVSDGYPVSKPTGDFNEEGATFSYWGTSSTATDEFNWNTPITADLDLYAIYNVTAYTVTFNFNGGHIGGTEAGAASSTTSVSHGTAPTAANVPSAGTSAGNFSKAGYDFGGWAETATGTTAVTPTAIAITADKTYYAIWTPVYDITYVMPDGFSVTVATNDSSGKPFAKYTYSPTDARTLPVETDLSDVSNATFAGWYTDADYTTAVTSVPAGSTGNKTYYAKYTRSITIYLEAIAGAGWGTTLASDVTAVYGKPLTAPDAVASASKPGYTLVGWKSGLDGVVSFVFGSTPYDDPCNGFIWGVWTEGSVTNFSGTLAEFIALDFNVDGTGTAESPCPVTITGVTGSSDFDTIVNKLDSYQTPSYDPGVYCTLDLSGCNFTVIPRSAFTCSSSIGNRGIMGITLPDTVTTIEYGAFYDTGVTSITLPANLQSIARHAFRYSDLTSVTIPSSTTTISISAFQESSNLETFTAIGTWTLYDGDGNEVIPGITLNAQKMKDPGTVLSGYDDSTHREYYYQRD